MRWMLWLGMLPMVAQAQEVQFVYFQEAGEPYEAEYMVDLQRHATDLQAWYLRQLGRTFRLADPAVVHIVADHDPAWYVNTPDNIHGDPRWYRLGNIKTEVYTELGMVDFDPNLRLAVYPSTRSDGRVGANFGSGFMDGDDLTCIRNNGETYPYDTASPAHCLGHVAHELGHVFGLAHTGTNDDCMQQGFYDWTGTSMCLFGQPNRTQILAAAANTGWLPLLALPTCDNQDPTCAALAASGECGADPIFMLATCPESCGVCACEDADADAICNTEDVCAGDDLLGDGDGDGVCGGVGCVDDNPNCAFWASIGECAANPGYMLQSCAASCNSCACDDADGDGVCDASDACEGDDALGDVDGNGLCDVSLSVGPAIAGDPLSLTVSGAPPGADVVFLASARGDQGPDLCHPSASVCTNLERPVVVGSAVADGVGVARIQPVVPGGVPAGRVLYVEGVVVDGPRGQGTGVGTAVVLR